MAREREAARRIVAAYGDAWVSVQAEMRRFYDLLETEARRLGLSIEEVAKANPSWPYRAGNLRAISERFALELRTVVQEAERSVMFGQSTGVRLGLEHAEQLIRDRIAGGLRGALGSSLTAALSAAWNAPNFAALQSLVGMLADGSPLQRIFAEYGADAAQRLTATLLRGFTLGKGPREVARWLRADLGGNLSRALTISRTEIIRAYRSAKTDSFQANPDLVTGWRWTAALDDTTCIACLDLDGQVFDIGEDMESHPNCRCTQEPITPSYADLARRFGIPALADVEDVSLARQTGEQWFNRQAASVQASIVHPDALALLNSGRISFSDLSTVRHDRTWGRSPQPTPLRDLRRIAS